MKKIRKMVFWKYNFELVCITRGASYALIYNNGQVYEHSGFKVNVKDTVGSEDVFLAGFHTKYL